MREHAESARWFTVAEGADPTVTAIIYRGTLGAQRPRIKHFSVDIVSDRPWPPAVLSAVEELEGRLQERRSRARPRIVRWFPRDTGRTIELNLEDQQDFDLAMAVTPFTIAATGIDDRGTIIWDGNDTGDSGAFRLTEDEAEHVRRCLTAAGADPRALMPLDPA